MDKQTLVIYDHPFLYDILYELRHLLNFQIKLETDLEFSKIINDNHLVISKKNLSTINQLKIDEFPIEISKLIDILNINFLKKKIENKKNIKIGEYLINFNNRKIYKNKKFLLLTEKESAIINFLYKSDAPKSIIDMQLKVWGHKSKLDTHTVETHVYRLRQKIKKKFNDINFIKSSNKGYQLY
tara:strand:- start:2549 stop:3100 length:552 start_codon:yes stop_codon:yes gene_type:complete